MWRKAPAAPPPPVAIDYDRLAKVIKDAVAAGIREARIEQMTKSRAFIPMDYDYGKEEANA